MSTSVPPAPMWCIQEAGKAPRTSESDQIDPGPVTDYAYIKLPHRRRLMKFRGLNPATVCNNRPGSPFPPTTTMSTSEKYVGLVLAVAATGVVFVLAKKKWASRHLPFPPGPKGYPIIGNALGFPEGPSGRDLRRWLRSIVSGWCF